MSGLFCGIDLARRIEAAEADLIAAATTASRGRGARGLTMPIGGGFACFAEPGSPMNKVVGAGFGPAPDVAAWEAVERACAEAGAMVQVELSALADPTVGALLTSRGYLFAGIEHVLGLALPVEQAPVPAVDVRLCAADEFESWVTTVVEGFATPDSAGVPSHEEFPRDIVARAQNDIAAAGAVSYLARIDGTVAGGAGMRIADGVAQLTGASTVPAHRRRGVQSALLAARLRVASEAGCDIAVVTTQPGSTSQKNVQAKGFQLLYGRAVLVKPVDSANRREGP